MQDCHWYLLFEAQANDSLFNFFFSFSLAGLGLYCFVGTLSSFSEWSYSLLRCADFSLWWLFLLWSTGSRHAGFSSCF